MRDKRIQLFVLPYAGGRVADFKRMTDVIDKDIDVIVVEYRGRGSRAKDPFATSFESLFSDAAAFCAERRKPELPFAVMGYSMGSIIAYELVAQELIPGELKYMFLAAEKSPKERSSELKKVENPTDEYLMERAKSLGGIDERMLDNERFAYIYLRPMLSDYKNFWGYRFVDHGKRIRTNASILYCENDTVLSKVRKWEDLIDGQCSYCSMGDNHFFIFQNYKEIAAIINQRLLS